MTRFLLLSLLGGICAFPIALAQADEPLKASISADDDLVRLPGSGQLKSKEARKKLDADKLKPGGGLLASFDIDQDGLISADEFEAGIKRAFADADENEDGELTALEQQAWAASLPTRDDSLSNPTRFDPNLDRRVTFEEFSSVIIDLGSDYRGEEDAQLTVASLKASKKEERNRFPNLLQGQFETRSGTAKN
ncbi:EF-hand domain-containing protein [Henriciella litoralis]|uniref:hypothetical protein n=1 Tax=Henriciella litoralis TaxID=568102 RepID=UPI000A056ABE|nr:hypothetical protein [Henriciella litoralis]